MSNITNIIDVQRVNDEYKVIINIISEILQKIKYMNNNIEQFKSDNRWFSKCVGETRLVGLIDRLTHNVADLQEFECSLNKLLTELMAVSPDGSNTLKGDN